jgi:MOSC domain-containing protein YiiM
VTGSILQINISRGGVPKRPVSESVATPLGLEGDVCAHPEIHGGPRQAVLLIASEAVEELIARGYPLFFGALGENFTTRGLDRRAFRLGQRFRLGGAVIELTKVRALLNA